MLVAGQQTNCLIGKNKQIKKQKKKTELTESALLII